MAASGLYLTQVDVTERLSDAVVLQLFDDDGDGALVTDEEAALTSYILDAESEVEQSVRKTYGTAGLTWLREQATDAPRAAKRMMLDCFEVRAFRRHPEYIRARWTERERAVREDLAMLRLRELELDTVGSPEPAVNEGGAVLSGDPNSTTPRAKVFLDGTGAF